MESGKLYDFKYYILLFRITSALNKVEEYHPDLLTTIIAEQSLALPRFVNNKW